MRSELKAIIWGFALLLVGGFGLVLNITFYFFFIAMFGLLLIILGVLSHPTNNEK